MLYQLFKIWNEQFIIALTSNLIMTKREVNNFLSVDKKGVIDI
jgi:hypothetical protein